LRAGSHSSSTNQKDFENFLATDSLAVQLLREHKEAIEHAEAEKLQAAAEAQRKKDASDFLVPPPVAFGKIRGLAHFHLRQRLLQQQS
jgi:hypothetical protein